MSRLPRVVILGGGMAGLTTAWELTRGDWRSRYRSVAVYERSWRLGGKGASSRGRNGRIEEHGLHVLLGYYDATFRVMREVYGELDRPRTDPGCPIASWDDAVAPSPIVGLTDRVAGRWEPWMTRFSTNDAVPGMPDAEDRPLRALDIVVRSLRLLADFHDAAPALGSVTLGSVPAPPRRSGASRAMALTALAAALEAATAATQLAAASGPGLADLLRPVAEAVRSSVRGLLGDDPAARRTYQLVDLVATNVRGVLVDRLLTREEGFAAIDGLDYRDWLRRHGAQPETVDSAVVRGMYDLVFAYENGDPTRPGFSAGLGLQLASRMLLDFKGSIFWKMQAGMGEVVFAPLYQALERRGVEFHLMHRLDEVTVDNAANSVASLRLVHRVDDAGNSTRRPLVDVGGLPCWPDAPVGERAGDAAALELTAGRDFDVVVLAVSIGIVPEVCGQLVAASKKWQKMVGNVATVATQSFQLWLAADERRLGWHGPSGVTLSGFAPPFGTWASMGHLIEREVWPEATRPEAVAYFCGALDDAAAAGALPSSAVRAAAVEFLGDQLPVIWPGASAAGGGFDWDLLVADSPASGVERFDQQYWRANVDPSDRYVQSLPGTDRYRLAPGDTGFANLVVAGDWTDCGLNAGCIEAATRSGILAGRAVDRMAAGDLTDEEESRDQ